MREQNQNRICSVFCSEHRTEHKKSMLFSLVWVYSQKLHCWQIYKLYKITGLVVVFNYMQTKILMGMCEI